MNIRNKQNLLWDLANELKFFVKAHPGIRIDDLVIRLFDEENTNVGEFSLDKGLDFLINDVYTDGESDWSEAESLGIYIL